MLPKRLEKIRHVVTNKQSDLTIILENVHDPHNISAVLRSCDAVGIYEVFILFSDPRLIPRKLKAGKRTAAGTGKWIKTHYYTDIDACFLHVREKYDRVLGTYLHGQNQSLYDIDLTVSTAIVFGNEHDGISKDVLSKVDATMIIPQFGMAPSLNISVSCAIVLYEACRQRIEKGCYNQDRQDQQFDAMLEEFIELSKSSVRKDLN